MIHSNYESWDIVMMTSFWRHTVRPFFVPSRLLFRRSLGWAGNRVRRLGGKRPQVVVKRGPRCDRGGRTNSATGFPHSWPDSASCRPERLVSCGGRTLSSCRGAPVALPGGAWGGASAWGGGDGGGGGLTGDGGRVWLCDRSSIRLSIRLSIH